MKTFGKIVAVLLVGTSILGGSATASAAETPACKGAYLCDAATGTAAYAFHETERLPIASMCKIMTLLLTFEAEERGELSLGEEIAVSERAQSMGGSQVYLEAGLRYRAEDLMRAVAVCSANDACVALAERVSGSESAFIDRMNARARELGALNTLFSNCTGLPKEPQYSCAKDVAVMLRALLNHEKYYELCKERTENFAHPDGRTTLITNTNKLMKSYAGCDGGKTGFTNEAGFCLAATAKRGETRLIAVVIGASTSNGRFSAVSGLLDEGFGNFETKCLLGAGTVDGMFAQVRGSANREIPVSAKDPLCIFGKKGENEDAELKFELKDGLKAPIAKGEDVGKATLYRDGVEIASTSLLAGEDAMRYTWWEAYTESARNWD